MNNTIEDEVWKDVEGYEGKYQVSNFGRVKSLSRPVARTSRKRNRYYQVVPERMLKLTLNTDGYPTVKTLENNKGKTVKVHRLVALAFIENPNEFPEVNHKDEVKDNNHASNLEWCTRGYNNGYGTRVERIQSHVNGRSKMPVKATCLKTGDIKTYESMLETEIEGFDHRHVSKVCTGKRKSHKGYKWEFI